MAALDLPRFTTFLERGAWPVLTAAAMAHLAHASREHALLVVIQIQVAWSMRCQALGLVDAARDVLDKAAGALPAAYRREERGHVLAVVVHRRPADRGLAVVIWRTARVIAREQAGLSAHEADLRPGLHLQKELVTIAYIEFMRRVDCDPHLLAAPPAVRNEIPFEATATLLAQRATNLCRLADPRCPRVAESAFKSAGGTAGLRAAAYRRINERENGPRAQPPGTPLRDADIEACRRARLYGDTTEA